MIELLLFSKLLTPQTRPCSQRKDMGVRVVTLFKWKKIDRFSKYPLLNSQRFCLIMSLELEQDALKWAHPLIREWFMQKLGLPTQPQQEGWPSILSNKTTLISAPTGSGKTLAAFLIGIDYLVRKSLEGQLGDKTEVIYISPLKALSNDIHKNLAEPLIEIAALAKSKGLKLDEIRVAVRTGDTLPRERQAMLKKPPHILVTTPESFYILLTAEKSRIRLKDINTVIVDEIHAVANDKRGAHLSLSLERLEALC